MSKPVDQTLYDIQTIVNKFSLIERNHNIQGTELQENDVVHSYSVAILCWYIIQRYSIDLNLEKILKYALVHDIAEVYAGDINTYASTKDRASKIKKERAALKQLASEFLEFPDFINSATEYESKIDEEALFVWTVDKMQAIILGDLDQWRPYKRININYTAFCRKNSELLSIASPFCKEIFISIIEYSKTTFYDQPTQKT